MEITRKDSKTGARISCSGELTIYHAATAKPLLLDDARPWPARVQLDLSGVSELDTAGVQLLLMLQRSVSAAGSQLTLQKVSTPVSDVLAALQLPFATASGVSQ